MQLGGSIKRLAYTTAGGGLGAIKGLARGAKESLTVSKNTSEEFNSKVSDTWKSSATTWSKLNETTALYVEGLAKTGWYMTKTVVANIGFGTLSGFAAGSALSDKDAKVELHGKDKQLAVGNGIQSSVTLERGRYGSADNVKLSFSKPSTEFIQQDRITGSQVVGDQSGKGPLLLMN